MDACGLNNPRSAAPRMHQRRRYNGISGSMGDGSSGLDRGHRVGACAAPPCARAEAATVWPMERVKGIAFSRPTPTMLGRSLA